MLALSLWLCGAWAQGLDQHHPDVPAATVAAENGPGALWVNPANLAFDKDPRFGFFYQHRAGFQTADSLAATAGVQGLQAGLHMFQRTDPTDNSVVATDWSLDYGTSIPLPERVAIGLTLSWNFIDGGTNYVGYDAGVTWRPLPWFGLAAAAQNVGSPDPQGLARPRTTAGLAFRPAGDLAILGLDYGRTFATGVEGQTDDDRARAGLRVRPIEGLYLKASTDLDVDVTRGTAGLAQYNVGAEIYIDGVGGGLAGSTAQGSPNSYAWFGTDEPGESLIRTGRQVDHLDLAAWPYEPRATLLVLEPGPSWLEVMERLRRAEEDRSVKALVLRIRGPGLSWARWQELADRVQSLRDQDKLVVAYLDGSVGNGAYALATACDRIYLHPGGDLGLVGLNAELQNLRGLLDLVGVEPQFVRRDEYKSGPETFTRTEPSPANLEATGAMIDDLYGHLVDAVATRTEGDEDLARERIDAGPWTATDAREVGLVDALLYPDQVDEELERLLAGPIDVRRLLWRPQRHSAWEDPAKIALVYVDGAIVDGESSGGGLLGGATAGADTIVRALRRAQEDRTVRAIVLRVDSPGGSALASDRIWRAIEEVKDSGKPVVVSMGGVAASGGYYVAAGADAIWAEPATITGSIGVYGGKFSTAQLLDTVGVGVTPITRGRNADLFSATRPWDDVQRAKMQAMVDETYRRFKKVVSDGRAMTVDEVEEVARGRVWTGQRAVDNGLVDELGSLHDAINDARERAGIGPKRSVGLISYSQSGSLLETLAPSALSRVMGPFDELLLKTREPRQTTGPLGELEALIPDLAPAVMIQAQHPDTTLWMMDPWLVDPTTR